MTDKICKVCKRVNVKKFYSTLELCGACYSREKEKVHIKKECTWCKKVKVCRYKGCCSMCYMFHRNKDYYSKVLKRNLSNAYKPKPRFNQAKAEARRSKINWELTFDQFQELIDKSCFFRGNNLTVNEMKVAMLAIIEYRKQIEGQNDDGTV